MKLTKAIEILERRVKDFRPGSDPKERDATKLGIEALKAIRTGREDYYEAGGHQLPGETPQTLTKLSILP